MFLILVNMDGRLRHKMLRDIICRDKHEDCKLKNKPSIGGNSLLYSLTQLMNI
jgi:hypothetical protein